MSTRIIDILIVIVLLLGGLIIAGSRVQTADTMSGAPVLDESAGPVADTAAPLPDHPAPEFSLADTGGTMVSLRELRGKVVLINVWATWCPPCRAEMPAIQAVYEQYRDQGFVVLAVNFREDPAAVTTYLAEQGLTFPALLDYDGAVGAAYQARALPASFFVDRRGVIRTVYHGPMPRGVIAGTVEQLLSEPLSVPGS